MIEIAGRCPSRPGRDSGRRVCRTVAAALFAWTAGCAWAADGARLDFRLEAPDRLRALIETHVAELRGVAAPVSPGERLGLLRRIRGDIGELLATEGYFSPVIDIGGHSGAAGEQLLVTVEPGARTRVGGVALEFRGAVGADAARVAALRAAWGLPPGRPFRQDDWDAAKRALLGALSVADYPAAAIAESRAAIDPAQASAELTVVADSGPAFRLGDIEVSGLARYSPALVRRYSDLEPGEPYRQDRLLDFQAALQNSPYFASVVVDVAADPDEAAAAPVRVQLRERKPRRLGFGAGVSSNTGYRAEAVFRNHDFLRRAWDLSTGLRLEQTRRFAFADVLLPPGARDYRDSFGLLFDRNDQQGLVTLRYGAGAVRTRLRGNIETRLALNAQRERRVVDGLASDFINALTVSWGWTYRDVDDPLDPRDGYVWSVEAGGAAKVLLSSQNFARGLSRLQRFFPVGARDVLILRGELGLTAARSRAGVPESFLFRAGGAQSVRGYAYQSLGAREGSAVVGGRRLVTGSIEYVHWWQGDWGSALFLDAGDAGDTRDDFRLRVGYGAGVRWKSPAGPLAFDLAYGHQARRLRAHFSVSIAF